LVSYSRIAASIWLMLLFGGGVVSAQEVVVTASGDRLVGEIQKVEQDVLTHADPGSAEPGSPGRRHES
jgi:hypothetical protein